MKNQDTSKEKKYKDEEWLHQKYHEEGLTQREIADLCGVYRYSVQQFIYKYDIETRSAGHRGDD